ncbi:unnamed protein product [Parnassius apollo]|uniref:(apollo) hypothetical protein n=1 Tax=Parnassius apollo TaxID=110799 RepID=A0A8S3WI53_PARAO|nr:unnamed protein product [Parnassius apollo]
MRKWSAILSMRQSNENSKIEEIHLPSGYSTITKEARRINPYEVIQVDYKFVKNYADTENWYYKSIRPGRRTDDPQVVDIRAIKYNTMTDEVKLNFDEDWTSLPQRPKIISSEMYSSSNVFE